MKKYSISIWLSAVTVLLGTASCHKDDAPWVDPSSVPVRTIVVNDEMAKKLQSISDSKLVFTGLAGTETPEVGDIICAAPTDKAPYGFFYGVKSVTKDGNNTIIETKAASIADAVGKDSVSVTAPLGTIGDIIISETIGSATLTGSFTGGKYELNFAAAVNERKTTYLKVSCTVSGTFTLTVDGTFYVNSEELTKLLTKIEPDPITITMKGIPIVITPKIPISFYAKYDGPFNGSIITAKHAYSAEAGVLYKDGKLTNYHEDHSPTARPFLTKLDMILSGSIVTSILSDVSWQYYNHTAITDAAIGLYGKVATPNLTPEQHYSNDTDPTPTLLAAMGENSRVTASPTEFGINAKIDNLADTVEYTTLKQKIFPEFEPIVLSNITDNSATARTTITSPTLTWIYPVTEHGLCWGTTSFPDVTSYAPAPHTLLGALNATGTTIEAELTNLEKGTPYFIRPYFTNTLGTFYGNFKYQGSPITPCPAGQSITVGDITWACSNLGAAGVYTSPDSVGAYFRWNRLEWDDELSHIPQLGDVWTVNPCPEGWKLPTTNDIMNSFGGGLGKLKECVANVDGRLASGLCCETPEGILFFPYGGYLDSDGVTKRFVNELWIVLDEMLHAHSTEYTFLLTYYGLLSSNVTGYYHVSVPLSLKGEGSGYPVRCMKDPWW
jgi:hypothetical protein